MVDGWIDENACTHFLANSFLAPCKFVSMPPPSSHPALCGCAFCVLHLLMSLEYANRCPGTMKDIYKDEDFEIPDGVSVSVKSRLVTVKGPRGELTKSLRHINMEIKKVSDKKIKLIVWHGGRKHVACLRTVRSLITNMIQGVTKVSPYPPRVPLHHCRLYAFPVSILPSFFVAIHPSYRSSKTLLTSSS